MEDVGHVNFGGWASNQSIAGVQHMPFLRLYLLVWTDEEFYKT